MHFLITSMLFSIEILDLRTGDSDVHFLVSSGVISSKGILDFQKEAVEA